jgi:hypothetical protein
MMYILGPNSLPAKASLHEGAGRAGMLTRPPFPSSQPVQRLLLPQRPEDEVPEGLGHEGDGEGEEDDDRSEMTGGFEEEKEGQEEEEEEGGEEEPGVLGGLGRRVSFCNPQTPEGDGEAPGKPFVRGEADHRMAG